MRGPARHGRQDPQPRRSPRGRRATPSPPCPRRPGGPPHPVGAAVPPRRPRLLSGAPPSRRTAAADLHPHRQQAPRPPGTHPPDPLRPAAHPPVSARRLVCPALPPPDGHQPQAAPSHRGDPARPDGRGRLHGRGRRLPRHPPASIQHGRVYSGAGHVHAWARARPDPRAFDAALHALADELNAATNLIDYQRRRDALRTWCLDTDTWQQLTSRLPLTPGPIQPDLGDRKRQCASVVVWPRITQGEHLFAPHPIEEEQPPAVRRAWRLRRDTTWFLFQTDRPKRHYADLRKLLDAYADQLAERIDAGWTAANQEQTSPPSSNPEPSRP